MVYVLGWSTDTLNYRYTQIIFFGNPFIYTSPQLAESNPQLETELCNTNVNIFEI
jgi:hypothetical protein